MNAMNRHQIEITGQTLHEIAERAASIFDKFFDRKIGWEVVRFDAVADLTELRNGVGQITNSEVTSWTALIEAEARGLFIGAAKTEPAMLFKPLGS